MDSSISLTNSFNLSNPNGINSKGFGVIPKAVMMDHELSMEAKGIYALIISYAGNSGSAFPSRSRMISDLNMSKSSFYAHFKKLVDFGYISVKKSCRSESGRFSNNVYIVEDHPKKYIGKNDETSKKIQNGGIRALGYGFISKTVMLDQRLNVKAKALMAYFCSFSGVCESTHERVVDALRENILFHLKICESLFDTCKRMLQRFGYISFFQKFEKGRLGRSHVIINENPDSDAVKKNYPKIKCTPSEISASENSSSAVSEATPNTASDTNAVDIQSIIKQDTVKEDNEHHQQVKEQYAAKQDTVKQNTENRDTNINNSNNNKDKINNNNRENTHANDSNNIEQNKSIYTYNSFVGSLTITKKQYDILSAHYDNLNDLLDKVLCCYAQRNSKPKSIYHFICELAMNWNWPIKEKTKESSERIRENQERILEERLKKEEEEKEKREIEKYMSEHNIKSYEEAHKEYKLNRMERLNAWYRASTGKNYPQYEKYLSDIEKDKF